MLARSQVRHGAAPGARELGEQGGGDRHALRDRRRGPVPASAGAVHPPDRRQAGPGGGHRRGGPPARARQGQRLLPLRGLPHHAALHRGGHLDRRQEGPHRVQAPAGAAQGSRARRKAWRRTRGRFRTSTTGTSASSAQSHTSTTSTSYGIGCTVQQRA
ncbi:Alpha carbonic anhydrase 7 [Zea mays]|uniref:Alpha carbonic anhydrase 7 n=1 Tax=Zea mays TaxID=4577 RepID=A0A1D6PZC1_MAIZE|nr:Alpha carbonic anhydrase 7 [Zea mays]